MSTSGTPAANTATPPMVKIFRAANKIVRPLLASRLHKPLSGRLMLLTYKGHRTGREAGGRAEEVRAKLTDRVGNTLVQTIERACLIARYPLALARGGIDTVPGEAARPAAPGRGAPSYAVRGGG